jgi:hypothetical protein
MWIKKKVINSKIKKSSNLVKKIKGQEEIKLKIN